jgi:hypothetical protein
MPEVMGSISAVRFNGTPIVGEILTCDLIRYEMVFGPPAETLTVPEQARMAWVIAQRLARTGGLAADVPADFEAFLDDVDFPPAGAAPKAPPRRRPRSSSQK